MTKHAKLLAKLLSKQAGFTWPELVSLLCSWGIGRSRERGVVSNSTMVIRAR